MSEVPLYLGTPTGARACVAQSRCIHFATHALATLGALSAQILTTRVSTLSTFGDNNYLKGTWVPRS